MTAVGNLFVQDLSAVRPRSSRDASLDTIGEQEAREDGGWDPKDDSTQTLPTTPVARSETLQEEDTKFFIGRPRREPALVYRSPMTRRYQYDLSSLLRQIQKRRTMIVSGLEASTVNISQFVGDLEYSTNTGHVLDDAAANVNQRKGAGCNRNLLICTPVFAEQFLKDKIHHIMIVHLSSKQKTRREYWSAAFRVSRLLSRT